MTSGARARRAGRATTRAAVRRPRAPVWVAPALVLAIHAVLVVVGSHWNSVTFDELFHLPAGVATVTRGDFRASVAQPPLARVLYALPALAAGARPPADSALATHQEYVVGESFLRRNGARYTAVVGAARLMGLLLSLVLGVLVWRWARALYGEAGAMVALTAYAFAPDVLAQAGLVGMDLPTALAFTSVFAAFRAWSRRPAWGTWGWLALAVGAAAATRFSALELAPILALLALVATARRRLGEPVRSWAALAALVVPALLALQCAYAFQTSLRPLGAWTFHSATWLALQHAAPWLRVPLPDACVIGLDYIAFLARPGAVVTYLQGAVHTGRVWAYTPLALGWKWPLGFLGLLALALGGSAARRRWDADEDTVLLLPVAVMLGVAMFATSLNVGVRYLLPVVPLLCIALGRLAADGAHAAAGWRPGRLVRALAVALLVLQAGEALSAAPWYLSYFNPLAGDPARRDRLLNDSNVDWGQGLIALREDMRQLGIRRIHLAYHGTTDPAVYGIDYVPYLGGLPGPESDWLAVSSYYWVGLSQRMVTPRGRTDFVRFDFSAMAGLEPVRRPAGCMYLFRLR